MRNIYAVLDIGSASIKLIVGEVVNGTICVLFSKKAASHGVRNGLIENMESIVYDIRTLLDEASSVLNASIERVALCIPSNYTRLYKSVGNINIESPSFKITNDDVIKVLKKSKEFDLSDKEEIITVMPIKYYLDSKVMEELPIDEISETLKVESLIITTRKKKLYSYITAVEKAGAQVMEITVDTYASAKEALNSVYLQEGVVIVDIGNDGTTISFFEDGYLKFISSVDVGGLDITRNIASMMKITLERAENYKIRYGNCDENESDEDLIHTTRSSDQLKHYTQKDLSSMIVQSVEELMNIIKTKVDLINDGRTYETIIVGGGGELPCIENVASRVLGTSVRTYRPDTIGARDMQYVFCLGMIYYLDDRAKIIGSYEPSVILSDITNTMSYRLKGLTVNKNKNKNEENQNKGKFMKLLDSIFGEDKE